jgi:hypothetical protein
VELTDESKVLLRNRITELWLRSSMKALLISERRLKSLIIAIGKGTAIDDPFRSAGQLIVYPPSIGITAPVIMAAESLRRKPMGPAMSRSVAHLRSGIRANVGPSISGRRQ